MDFSKPIRRCQRFLRAGLTLTEDGDRRGRGAYLAKIAAPDEETLRYFPLPCTDLTLTDCPYTIGP